jgi:mannan endo-1,4-beta-mannosidase
MRLLSLNLLTASVTAFVLGLLTVPAMSVGMKAPSGPVLPVPKVRAFAVYVDPWHIDDWASAVGAQPTMAAKFEAFSRRRVVDKFTYEAMNRGIRQVLVSWEPWKPVPARLGVFRQSFPQRGYRNVDIANGSQDRYIHRVARGLARFDGTVYLRYAHEMNGFWYPWSWDARSYRTAWRRIVRIFRKVGAHNVRFVWSPNPNLFERQAPWMRNLLLYWPGAKYVDALGSTMINFGGKKAYRVSDFVPRLRALHRRFHKPLMITEANTQYGGRVEWLRGFRHMLDHSPWITAVAWSQLPSRGAAQMQQPGDLHWDIQRDPCSAAVIRGIVEDGLGTSAPPQATVASASCGRRTRADLVMPARARLGRAAAAPSSRPGQAAKGGRRGLVPLTGERWLRDALSARLAAR